MTDDKFIFSNLSVFYEIAKDSYSESVELLAQHRVPKPNGEKGYILSPDPSKRSFKQALIAIAFLGSYIDLHLRLAYIKKHHEHPPKNWERNKTYRQKIESFGVENTEILELFDKFKDDRNDVAHEKPITSGIKNAPKAIHGTAQETAAEGIKLVEYLKTFLPL